MAKPLIRLYLDHPLTLDATCYLTNEQAHYLHNVMRQKVGDQLLLFNGKDGQWLGAITALDKKHCQVMLREQTHNQCQSPTVMLCFAPVKNAPIQNIVRCATELGVAMLQPIITERTIVRKVNVERLHSICVEAAEQCMRLHVPVVNEPISLNKLFQGAFTAYHFVLCDESGGGKPIRNVLPTLAKHNIAFILGPEGGFSPKEFETMKTQSQLLAVGMGARILKADTAALAALTCYQSLIGDWDEPPAFE